MNQQGEGKPGHAGQRRRHRERRQPKPSTRPDRTSPRWSKESGAKVCRKCGGRMFPADWIWQRYGLCLDWRCAKCKEKVLARCLPFKRLRKRKPDPDEVADLSITADAEDEKPSAKR